MPFLQVTRFCASSFRNLSFLILSTTHSCHVFLPLPFSPSTTISLHAATQSSLFLRSTCPNHLNLPRRTTSNTHSIPNQPNNSSSFFYPLMSHHTSTLPSSSPLSPISAYPLPSSPMSHYHTPSPFVYMLYTFFFSTTKKLLSRSKSVKVL